MAKKTTELEMIVEGNGKLKAELTLVMDEKGNCSLRQGKQKFYGDKTEQFQIDPAKQAGYLNQALQAWFAADPTLLVITIRRK